MYRYVQEDKTRKYLSALENPLDLNTDGSASISNGRTDHQKGAQTLMKLLTVDAVAARLSISSITVRRLIADGKLPSVRPSARAVRVPESAVDALVNRTGRQPAAAE